MTELIPPLRRGRSSVGDIMKYQVQKGCVIKGSAYKVGDVVEIDESTARSLMGIGRVAPYHEPVVQDRSVGLSSSDQAVKRRARPKKFEDVD